ncbi:hypothetical protein ACWYXF_16540 [Lactiplantibacillus plantarum]|uniref:hypothetical protein n=1 Tax=Lactiplantibacillus plantarum TaxID=1590 RepID=UPI003EE806EC
MKDIMDLLPVLIVVVILPILYRFVPVWIGILPPIIYLGYMIYLVFEKGSGELLGIGLSLVIGEVILIGLWLDELYRRRKKEKKEIDKMKAKDLLKK